MLGRDGIVCELSSSDSVGTDLRSRYGAVSELGSCYGAISDLSDRSQTETILSEFDSHQKMCFA